MNQFKISLLLSVLTVSFFSCTTSKDPVAGNWNCSKIIPAQEMPENLKPPTVLTEEGVVPSDKKGASATMDPDIKNQLATYTDISKVIKIRDDKTVALVSKNSTLKGRWTLDKESNSLVITLDKTKKVIRMKFSDPDRQNFSFRQNLRYGNFDVHYRKQMK